MDAQQENTIIVTVNGKEYTTIIDKNNVQRFHTNALIRHLVSSKQVDLNTLCIDLQKGKFTLNEYQQFYMGMGYSVCGFDEIFGLNSLLTEEDKAIIENPLWNTEFAKHLK